VIKFRFGVVSFLRISMFFGKIIAGLIGAGAGGIPGLILGLLVGHAFDRGLSKVMRFSSPENIERIKTSFFETTFLLSGYLAKSDGRISKLEIAHTGQLFVQMGLSTDQRKRAIDQFHLGSVAGFDIEPVIADFLETCGPQRQLQQTLLLFLISLAHADQGMEPVEHAALVRIANVMGLGSVQLEQLLRMAQAQDQFHSQGNYAQQPGGSLEQAYIALGIEDRVSDKELKQAYRKLMSENHPDKLIAKGVPEEMVKLATARSQEIQSAYELVRKSRKAKR
jgi:DnaJ like chaperone protein